MRLRTLLFPIITLALAGCGGDDDVKLEKGPFLFVDRESLGFDQEFGSGTYLGRSTFNTLYIENRGDEPLELTEVIKAAPSQFKLNLPAPLPEEPVRLESRKRAYIEVQFTPTEARVYRGKFTLKSNAANAPLRDIALSGCGIPENGPRPAECDSPPAAP
jgi:hypothetical protein